jgi:choline dehydrogenase
MGKADAEFDYIVIGAGSAGCVVAGRLGEAGHKVLLLEAGGAGRSPFIHVPLGYSMLYNNPRVNWCFNSEPEPHLNNRRLFQPRGKVMGGTGAINGMIYMRGQPEDFDGWKEQGCAGWGWDDVLPFFKKSEDQERGPSEYHGAGGPVSVSDLPSPHALGEAFHAASEKLGIPRNDDFNGATQMGTGYVQTTTRKARRWSTADGYLRGPAMQNIRVEKHALAESLLMEGKRITGVEWSRRGDRNVARARCEVILCGGTFSSPQLLLRSGIGPAAHLREMGIDVTHDLPGVGENLQDHFGIGLEFESKLKTTVNDLYNNKLRGGLQLLRYLLFRTGPFADNGNYSNTFIHSSEDIPTPDMMVTFMAWCTTEDLKPHPFSGFTILAEHMRPQSRGHVRLKSRDARIDPAILFNFFESEADHRAAVAGLRLGRKISQTHPMADCVVREISPGLDVNSDAEMIAYCRQNGLSLLHPVGTCAMGNGPDAVVDTDLKVQGLSGLRVIDASIMPTIVTANTNAAAIMIGEKGVDQVLKDARG